MDSAIVLFHGNFQFGMEWNGMELEWNGIGMERGTPPPKTDLFFV